MVLQKCNKWLITDSRSETLNVDKIDNSHLDSLNILFIIPHFLHSVGVAGCVSRTATAPLDRIKVIYQARGGKAASEGLVGSVRKMLKEGGWASMWRGNGVNCLKIAPESAFKFQAYEAYKRLLFGQDSEGGSNSPPALHEKFVSGALAGATAQTIIYPMEV